MARFLLKESRYIRAAGQGWPAYVYADPDHPVVIDMPEEYADPDGKGGLVKRPFIADGRLVPVPDETPLGPWLGPQPQLVPAYADVSKEPVPSAARVQGPVSATPPTRRRVADS